MHEVIAHALQHYTQAVPGAKQSSGRPRLRPLLAQQQTGQSAFLHTACDKSDLHSGLGQSALSPLLALDPAFRATVVLEGYLFFFKILVHTFWALA